MENYKICIIACGINIQPYLDKVLSNFSTIETWFQETKIVVFENDSVDNTREILTKWSNGTNKVLLTEDNLIIKIPSRTERLAYIRNKLLDHIPAEYDYFMMVDIDDVFIRPVEKKSFESCFQLENWDIITANSYIKYYDIYALRIPNVIDYDCWKRINELIVYRNYKVSTAFDECITYFEHFMMNIKAPLYVDSAFNIAILGKVKSLQPCCKYSSSLSHVPKKKLLKIFQRIDYIPVYECEHIAFHKCIRSHGGKILFNPDFKL